MSRLPDPVSSENRRFRILAGLLIGLLVLFVPPFLCMPPDNDVVLFDVAAREQSAVRFLYRHVFDNHPPGPPFAPVPPATARVRVRAADEAMESQLIGRVFAHMERPAGAAE